MSHPPRSHTRQILAFTLIELLVVISIIALLISILLPTLRSAREVAQDAQCKSNQRQGMLAFVMYANDDADGRIPPMWEAVLPRVGAVWWSKRLSNYMGHEGKVYGQDYLRCPAQGEDAYRTYGVNYGGRNNSLGGVVYLAQDKRDAGDGSFWEYYPGIRYDDITPRQFIFGCHSARDWGRGDAPRLGGTIYTPNGRNALTYDWDGDGLRDSSSLYLDIVGPYNGFGPWHPGGTGNMAFKDGHVESITIEQFVTNDHDRGLWGGYPDYLPR